MFRSKEEFKQEFGNRLQHTYQLSTKEATPNQLYQVLSSMVQQQIGEKLASQKEKEKMNSKKKVYYFSMEYLLGRLLSMNLMNLGLYDFIGQSLEELGLSLQSIQASEPDAGLGNGGLGRLAACYLESMASLDIVGCGCGLGYKHGLFQQKFVDGYQIELPEHWLKEGYAWQTRRSDQAVEVHFGGQVAVDHQNGKLVFHHYDYQRVLAVPYYLETVGAHSQRINELKLWTAEMPKDDLSYAQSRNANLRTDFIRREREIEDITEFLYPDDSKIEGRYLRLKQQYFLSSAGIQSIIADFKAMDKPWHIFPDYVSIHINDTHPVLVIPELMRILLDQEGLEWNEAWTITCASMSYTNHTILPEAMETWPLEMLRSLMPRIAMIIEEINVQSNQECRRKVDLNHKMSHRIAIVHDGMVHMANLAVACSRKVNGVAALHTEILKTKVMNEFYQIYPEKFINVTNGINHRRWLALANPLLASLITEAIGDQWINEGAHLENLMPLAKDASFQERFRQVKLANKIALAQYIENKEGIRIDPHSMFDAQIKRLHGYKRQLMNILHIIYMYHQIKEGTLDAKVPRTFLFGAKAAPGYFFSKDVIKLINTVADVVNQDSQANQFMKVVFVENYGVSVAEHIIPAVDLSEQISTASKEASGTGNMKMMMNGALTMGTLDGANVEIRDLVGDENIFIFGLTSQEVLQYYEQGTYSALDILEKDKVLGALLQKMEQGEFSKAQNAIHNIKNSLLLENDQFFVLKDFEPYLQAMKNVDMTYLKQDEWTRKAIVNVAKSGYFTGDRSVNEYAAKIWQVPTIDPS